MGELKSAWEIAQEKADRLGKLSAEEEEQQRKQKCHQIGQAITQRWLNNLDLPNMAAALNSYREEEKGLIRQASFNCLVKAIGFNSSKVGKAIQEIVSLEPATQPIIEGIIKLIQEYEEAERKTRQELESNYREVLHQLRISGTGVGDIDIEATPRWQQAQQRLIKALEPRLNSLKQELTKID